MLGLLLTFILARPFVSSLTYPTIDYAYSLLLTAFIAVWFLRNGIRWELLKRYQLIFMGFLCAIICGIVFSSDIAESTAQAYKILIGLLLFLAAGGLDEYKRRKVIEAIILSAIAVCVFAFYQYFFGLSITKDYISKALPESRYAIDFLSRNRIFFPFVLPSTLGGFLAMTIPLAFSIKRYRIFVIPLFAALLLTQSLGSLLALLAAIAFYFLVFGNSRYSFLIKTALGCSIAVIFLYRSIAPTHATPLFSSMMRIAYWKDTFALIISHPLQGIGLGQLNIPSSTYTHNSYLQFWAETGLLGIAALFMLVFSIFRALKIKGKGLQDRSTMETGLLGAAFSAFAFHNLFDFTFFLPEVSFIWWILAGLIAAL